MSRRPALLLPLLGLMLLGSVAATVPDLNEAGKAAYAKGDFATAERLFSQALVQAPDEPLLHYHRGIALMRLSRWREASTAFEAAVRLNPPRDVALAAREGLHSLAPLLREPATRRATSDDTAVTLRRVGGSWFAQVRLNNSRTAQFLVDTGATTCVIFVTIPSLRVGDVEAQDVIAVVHAVGPSMDGILGNTFLSRFTVTLDPERGLLRLSSR